jgi:hypothetical protein
LSSLTTLCGDNDIGKVPSDDLRGPDPDAICRVGESMPAAVPPQIDVVDIEPGDAARQRVTALVRPHLDYNDDDLAAAQTALATNLGGTRTPATSLRL